VSGSRPGSLELIESTTRVRIRRVPPTRVLEGVDVSAYGFRAGQVYELDTRVANVLLAWDYAELADRDRGPARRQK
jgi:hypothetical protein